MSDTEDICTIVNPIEDDIELELEFYDPLFEDIENVTMPNPPAQ